MIRIGLTLRIWHSKAVILRIMFLKGGYSTLLRFLSPQDQCTSYSPAKHCESMDFKTSLSHKGTNDPWLTSETLQKVKPLAYLLQFI